MTVASVPTVQAPVARLSASKTALGVGFIRELAVGGRTPWAKRYKTRATNLHVRRFPETVLQPRPNARGPPCATHGGPQGRLGGVSLSLTPHAAARHVQVDVRIRGRRASLRELILGGQKRPLRIQHLEEVGHAALVAHAGERCGSFAGLRRLLEVREPTLRGAIARRRRADFLLCRE